MGEYALYNGQRVKIGTCEDMYYLRADQARLVAHERGNVNPAADDDRAVIRFRFPWPDEDTVEPGAFDPYDRGMFAHRVTPPAGVEHHSVQFSAPAGYLVSLPCPEGQPGVTHGMSTKVDGLTVHRNGFGGSVRIVQQGYRNGHLALICACGGCGARYNVPTWELAEPIVVAVRAEADRRAFDAERAGRTDGQVAWYHAVADRIAAGYGATVPA